MAHLGGDKLHDYLDVHSGSPPLRVLRGDVVGEQDGDHRPDGSIRRAAVGLGRPRVSVVIAALNEEKNLPYVLARLPDGLHEVVFVDGHSTDDTIAAARRLRPGVRIVVQSGRGKGNALAEGACDRVGQGPGSGREVERQTPG